MQHLLPHPKHKGDEKEWQDEGKQNSPATDAVLSLYDYCLTYFVVNTVCLYPNKSILAVGSSAKVFRMTPRAGAQLLNPHDNLIRVHLCHDALTTFGSSILSVHKW